MQTRRTSSNILIAKSMKIRQVGAELFHADKRDETDSRFVRRVKRDQLDVTCLIISLLIA